MNPHPKKNTTTYRPFLEKLGGSPVSKFVGEFGELFYDPADPTIDTLRISDGKTPGGVKLSQNIRDSISDIFNMIDGPKLEQIQDVINSFLEVNIDQFSDLTDRVVNLEDNAVRRTGDVMTGGLKIENERNYKLEVIPEATGRPAGSTRFTYNDNVQAELYWDPSDSHLDFSFPSNNRVAEADVMLELGKDALTVFTKTDIKGDLFVNDIDVIEEIKKIKIELAAELVGLSIALKTKYNKDGGDVFGPLQVKPGGPTSSTLFSVSPTGPETVAPPAGNFSLTNKLYVDNKFADAGSVKSVAGKEGDVILVKADITDFSDADYATAAQGEKADSALQSGDNVSELVNDAGYLVQSDLDGLSSALVFKGSIDATTAYPTEVSSGDVWANTTTGTADGQWTGLTDVTSGDLLARGDNQWVVVGASTVPDLSGYVQTGDNVSTLTNDAGYITVSEVPEVPVLSVAGKEGNVTLVKADILDLVESDYATAAQGEKADSALQSGDNVSELVNDAGYVTKEYSDAEDEKIKDNVSSIIGEILVDLGNHDHVFNYHVVRTSNNFNDGDMTGVDEDPIQNQMFLFYKNEIDGSEALFWNEVDDGDILIVEQDLGKRLRYEILSPASFLGDQVRLNVNYLDTDGTGASQFYFDRDAAIYINKAGGDRSDNATQDWTTTNFLKRAGDNVTDATENVEYKWNQDVVISSTNNQENKGITIKGADGQLSILHDSSGNGVVRLDSGYRMYFESGHNFYITSNKGLDLKSQDSLYLMSESDIKFQSSGNQNRGAFTRYGLRLENSIESYDSASDYYRNKLAPTIQYVEHIAMPKNLNTLPSLP